MKLFRPILPGATVTDRVIACFGAVIGIAATGAVARWVVGSSGPASTWMIASLGASAVLVFAVPASPLAQPWSVVGGNIVSAMVGVAVVHVVPDPVLGSAIAVGLAIIMMSLLRCLHPPGGGTALIPILAGVTQPAAEWMFPVLPVAINAALLVGAAWCFHRFSGHSYPRRPLPDLTAEPPISDADIAYALSQLHEPLDVAADDLRTIATLASEHARRRR